MGKMNLLKSKWDGKVGQTVGAKWKNKATIRTYSIPSNPNTQAQRTVRGAFKTLTSFVALFAEGIKYLSPLDTSGMSVRNAIIKLNKEMIQTGTVTLADLQVAKGGLQKPQTFTASLSGNNVAVTWVKPTATNFTEEAKLVVIAVDAENQIAEVFEADYDAESASGTVSFASGSEIEVYAYYLDKRGSNKIGSNSVHAQIA
jgi:hypothetical protein